MNYLLDDFYVKSIIDKLYEREFEIVENKNIKLN